MFGRSLSATALDRTPPFSNIGVQRSTPHYSDKYPYVRYSYGNTDTALSVKTQTELVRFVIKDFYLFFVAEKSSNLRHQRYWYQTLA